MRGRLRVWRRLGGAMAGGAAAAGWDAWMSVYTKNQAKQNKRENTGMGLREDLVETTEASRATPRLSWFAYQQFTRFLGSVRSAECLTDEDDGVVVLEFLSGVGLEAWYDYLLLFDTTTTTSSALGHRSSSVTAVVSGAGRRSAALYTVEFIPTIPETAVVTLFYDADELRHFEGVFSAVEGVIIDHRGLTVAVYAGDNPRLIRSAQKLEWTVETVWTHSEEPPEIEHPDFRKTRR